MAGPGSAPAATRAAARRAESVIAELASTETINPAALHYANRLSDHLFVMARTAKDGGVGEALWVPDEK